LHNLFITSRLRIFWEFLFQFAINLPTVRDLKRAKTSKIQTVNRGNITLKIYRPERPYYDGCDVRPMRRSTICGGVD
jgi:hypothetical protein